MKAREIAPEQITIDGTLGSILAERGKLDEAHAMLVNVHTRSKSALDHAIAAAYLAKIADQRGDRIAARKWIRVARSCRTDHIVVDRIARQLAARKRNRRVVAQNVA